MLAHTTPALVGTVLAALIGSTGIAQTDAAAKQSEELTLQSIGPIAFAPKHTLLVSDPKAAAVFAVDVSQLEAEGVDGSFELGDLGAKLAALLATEPESVKVVDLAVHPTTKQPYLAVTRDDKPMIVTVAADGALNLVEHYDLKFQRASIPNPPKPGEGRRNRNRHMQSITDLAYVDGKVVIAGLSNEEFASKLRVVSFPFKQVDASASVEIYHGAHGAWETRSPVRTFAPYQLDGEPHLFAAYTCTPLVKFKLSDLDSDEKVVGTTIAELGNRNTPLDMVVYRKDGERFLLIANTSRGVMKVQADEKVEGITQRVSTETAGVPYETISDIGDVVQLAKLDGDHAVVLLQDKSGELTIKAIALP